LAFAMCIFSYFLCSETAAVWTADITAGKRGSGGSSRPTDQLPYLTAIVYLFSCSEGSKHLPLMRHYFDTFLIFNFVKWRNTYI
jgi:hypothetical protein